ncbi:MAG: phosphate acyltransferase [Elusimicrobiota bacterium]
MYSSRVILRNNRAKTASFWEGLRRRASEKKRAVLFPEATDQRVLSAARFLAEEGIVRPVLVGLSADIEDAARRHNCSLQGVEILDSGDAGSRARCAARLLEKRKAKGLTPEQAAVLAEDPLYFACLALEEGKAHGLAAGAVRTTADTVRAGFSCLGLAPGASVFFGLFVMECPQAMGGPRRLLFADSAVSPRPSHRALAAVGAEAAKFCGPFLGEEPRVAYLSFSTRGSAEDESALAMRKAAEAARPRVPGAAVDGEVQGDAALDREIAEQKGAGDSPLEGRANVLIFPDLNAGNIAYKLVRHLGGARAVGPLLPGLSRPMSDLSRGCNDEDIADAAALVALLEPPAKE